MEYEIWWAWAWDLCWCNFKLMSFHVVWQLFAGTSGFQRRPEQWLSRVQKYSYTQQPLVQSHRMMDLILVSIGKEWCKDTLALTWYFKNFVCWNLCCIHQRHVLLTIPQYRFLLLLPIVLGKRWSERNMEKVKSPFTATRLLQVGLVSFQSFEIIWNLFLILRSHNQDLLEK